MKAGRRRGRKVGKPRGKTCRWTAELEDVLKTAWARGGLRAARRAIRQHQPTWSSYSAKKRAEVLELCRQRAPRWTDADENHLLWSIDSNASPALIAERLGRTVPAVRKKLHDLDYTARVWAGSKSKMSLTCSRSRWQGFNTGLPKSFCLRRVAASPRVRCRSSSPTEKIPFETLSVDMHPLHC
jgi:hypothetical protein